MTTTKQILFLCICFFLLFTSAFSQSPKGQWGNVRPITTHPNLYYNQSEIDELRVLILNETGPARLVDYYNDRVKGTTAINVPDPWDTSHPGGMNQGRPVHQNNMKACIDYMLSPTQAKADKMKESIFF